MNGAADPFEELQKIIFGYVRFQFLAAAVKSNLFTLLLPGRSLDELAPLLGMSPRSTRTLLLGCCSLGLVRQLDGRFVCSDVAELTLVDGAVWDQRPLVQFGHGVSYRAMWWLHDSLLQDSNVGLKEVPGVGETVYARLGQNPASETLFHDMMGTVTAMVAARMVDVPAFGTFSRIVDVGGGAAINAIALADHWPNLSIEIMDLETVAEAARAQVAAAGLSGRIDVVVGDIFRDAIPPCEAVLLAHFLEIWGPEEIRQILTKAASAMSSGGTVLLVNVMQNDDMSGPESAAMSSAYFLALASGRGMAYTWNEYEAWLAEAGFVGMRRSNLTPDHGLIIARKP